jgi:hypothetical protein
MCGGRESNRTRHCFLASACWNAWGPRSSGSKIPGICTDVADIGGQGSCSLRLDHVRHVAETIDERNLYTPARGLPTTLGSSAWSEAAHEPRSLGFDDHDRR